MKVDTYSNVSQSPTLRQVDVRVKKSKTADKLSFPHHRGQIRSWHKERGEVLPETHSLAMASTQRQKLNMSHKSCECTNSRHVKSDGCDQDVQSSMWVFSERRHVWYDHLKGSGRRACRHTTTSHISATEGFNRQFSSQRSEHGQSCTHLIRTRRLLVRVMAQRTQTTQKKRKHVIFIATSL